MQYDESAAPNLPSKPRMRGKNESESDQRKLKKNIKACIRRGKEKDWEPDKKI